MGLADDITGVFDSVSDTVSTVSTDVSTTLAGVANVGTSFNAIFGDTTKGTPNAPKTAGMNSKLVLIGLALLALAFLWKHRR